MFKVIFKRTLFTTVSSQALFPPVNRCPDLLGMYPWTTNQFKTHGHPNNMRFTNEVPAPTWEDNTLRKYRVATKWDVGETHRKTQFCSQPRISFFFVVKWGAPPPPPRNGRPQGPPCLIAKTIALSKYIICLRMRQSVSFNKTQFNCFIHANSRAFPVWGVF